MSATIRRGSPPRGRRPVPRRALAKVSWGDRILSVLPVSEAMLRRAVTGVATPPSSANSSDMRMLSRWLTCISLS